MLKAPADFPYPGSEALLGDKRVRIIGELADGRRLVSAKGITRTVELDQLSDASLPDDPLGRWYGERVTRSVGTQLPTPTSDLYRDFDGFLRARGVDDTRMPTRHAFSHFLSLMGHTTTVRRVDAGNHRCVDLQLLPMQVAA